MEDIRQTIHFNPPKGWMNDPNGLIYINGYFHIFYQYYPEDTKWGPMHWGHAVSKDLISFEHLPIALYPTSDEYIFSGSAIIDKEDLLGVSENGKPVMVLFYTSHNPKTGEQSQSIAYSTDYINFTKWEGNPVLNTGKKDFRDPKVIKNNILGGYTMALAVGDRIEFYHSMNLIDWKFTGDFIPANVPNNTICECPDLMYFSLHNKYALSMSFVVPAVYSDENQTDENDEKDIDSEKKMMQEELHGNRYYIGDFDGNKFVMTQETDIPQVLDFGRDYYAPVSFAGINKPVMMGWGEDWNIARVNTAEEFYGKFSLARELDLVVIDGIYYISQKPVIDNNVIDYVNQYGYASVNYVNLGIDRSMRNALGDYIDAESYVNINAVDDSNYVNFDVKNTGDELVIAGERIKRMISGSSDVLVIEDCGYVEVYADGGLICWSQNIK